MLGKINCFQILKSSVLFAVVIASSLVFSKILYLPQIQNLTQLIQHYIYLYAMVLLLFKALSVIYPPVPGTILTLASVPIIGWPLAYLTDVIGGIVGGVVSFQLSKKYGQRLLNSILGKTITNKILSIKLKDRNQIESAIVLRIASGGIFSDGLAWGASLIGFRLLPFEIGYVISHAITTLPVFYFLGISVQFNSWLLLGTAMIVGWLVIYKFKGRYFE